MTSSLLPEGLRDRLPPQADAAAAILRAALDAIRAHGYERVAPPLAEYEESLVGRLKAGAARDLLRVADPLSQRTLALRPDITTQVGRIAATRLAHRPRPLRLSYGGPVVKLRATQLRPEREMTQIGAELIGRDTAPACAEIVALAVEALAAAGATGITVDLTLPNLVDTLAAGPLPLGPREAAQVRALLDAKDAGGLAAFGATAYLPLAEAAGPFAEAIARLRAFDATGALASRIAALEAIAARLEGIARVTLDPAERHGFEYQSWLGFSLFADGLTGEVGRGGSYAILHEEGREEPAVGFSIYPDPLLDTRADEQPPRRLFLPLGHDPAAANRLRAEGWITVAALDRDCAPAGCTHVLEGKEATRIG
ncbi:ATP phosphoribosyltransferase regulatory subunit [Sphingomonas sp. MAH-20]|uniref:ATP phosphoribosyltransferase regulatory subunit n=1 Tax=Sphingomonas horti TaxID=2682842 RepID=A0A6I4IZN3_9SPHN|nr:MULTISPECIES: ATP phosphoribosyltransferase regulatory subunit [Sphingomonas]MBA2920699.1 ATP phosphoribosyltransferase regulatory subunit [Sphingomonas sp. CGMCC 1.13658]MVO77635.1 ATP phosphoribosyltransferase regulatory subunit [Sphingomonas horti]